MCWVFISRCLLGSFPASSVAYRFTTMIIHRPLRSSKPMLNWEKKSRVWFLLKNTPRKTTLSNCMTASSNSTCKPTRTSQDSILTTWMRPNICSSLQWLKIQTDLSKSSCFWVSTSRDISKSLLRLHLRNKMKRAKMKIWNLMISLLLRMLWTSWPSGTKCSPIPPGKNWESQSLFLDAPNSSNQEANSKITKEPS